MRFTRLLRNESVTAEEMSRHAGTLTGGRAAGRDDVAIQDTSELALDGRRAAAAGYGIVGKGDAARGLQLHPVLSQARRITAVSDRESDFYELFARRPGRVELTVRACQNRRIEAPAEGTEGLLFGFIDGQPEKDRFAATIPPAPGRPERDVFDVYLRANPQSRHLGSPLLFMRALTEAFPWPPTQLLPPSARTP